MKIWCQRPLRQPGKGVSPISEMIQRDYALIKRKDTEILMKHPEGGLSSGDSYAYFGLKFLQEGIILKSMMLAPDQGFDGVLVACYFDPGVRAARQLLSIPVVGLAESSIALASLLGRFAIITSDWRYVSLIEENLRLDLVQGKAITQYPVRALTFSKSEEFFRGIAEDHGLVLENFEKVAESCVKEGAEVIIAGCGLLSPVLTLNGLKDVKGAPVIDPHLTAIKLLEMMVELHQAGLPVYSKRGIFLETPQKILQDTLASLR